MKKFLKTLALPEIESVVGGDCLCECHHPVYNWGHSQGKKGMSPTSEYCHNVLCADTIWDRSMCTNMDPNINLLFLSLVSTIAGFSIVVGK